MVAKNSSLTTGEQRKLKALEAIVDEHKQAFIEVGNALRAIQIEKLHTDVDETFEGYCKKRFGFTKGHAYRLIEAAGVVKRLQIGDTAPPDNEAQARILASLETEQLQADVWVKANETAPKGSDGKPKVTAAHVRKVADEITGKAKPPAAETEQEPEPEPVRPFAQLAELPDDLAEAFEAMKLALLGHKLAGWTEISRDDAIEVLESLKAMALAPSE